MSFVGNWFGPSGGIGGGESGGVASSSENVAPVSQGGVEKNIYVRSTGDDTTGDGLSVGTAYRTIRHALSTIPFLIYGERYIIECSGLGQELSTTPLEFPPIYSPDATVFNASPTIPGFVIHAPLTIEAAPTLLDTITAPELSGQVADSLTGLQTLNTTKSYTLDQHRGKIVRDATGNMGVIASNTAGPNSDLELTQNAAFTAPIEILEPSAEIRNSDAGGSNGVDMRNVLAAVQFNGIKMSAANPSAFRYGIFIDNPRAAIGFNACDVDGVFGALGTSQPSFSNTNITKRFSATGITYNLFSCFIDGTSIALRNSGINTDISFWFENIFDGNSAIGAGTGIEDTNRIGASLDRCVVRNSSGDGIFVPGGGQLQLRRTRLNNNAGNGVTIEGAARSLIRDVSGTGNTGLGIKLEDGAQSRLQGTVDPTGTGGDYQVGSNVAGTWGGFGGDENDLAAGTPQLCRMFT